MGISRTYIETGRNDPCPCGSGKKYKKCCLPLLEESLSIDSLKFSAYYKIAYHTFTNYKEFFRDTASKFERKDLASAESFEDLVRNKKEWEEPLDWFIFNEYVLKGKTPLQLFLEAGDATEKEKNILRRFDGTYWSLYEVKDLVKELGKAKFIDLFSEKEYSVFDENLVSIENGMVIFCRLVPYDHFYSIGYVFLPWLIRKPEGFKEVLDRFIGSLKQDNLSVEETLRIYGYKLYLFIKNFSIPEDEEEDADIASSIYRISNYNRVISLLQLSPYFYKERTPSDQEIFVCLKNPRSELIINNTGIVTPEEGYIDSNEESGIGIIRVDKDYLEVLAPTKKRLEAVEALLKELVGEYITLEDMR